MHKIVGMKKEKETKGTFRYLESGDPSKHLIRTLYLRKDAMGEEVPEEIQVTIEDLK